MATGNRTFTRNLYSVYSDVARLVRGTRLNLVNAFNVNSSATDAKTQLARLANRVQRQIMTECRNLSLTTSTLSVAASANSAAIPATLYGSSIQDAFYYNTSSIVNLVPIKVIGHMEARTLPVAWQNGQIVIPIPMYASLDTTETSVTFFPFLSEAATFKIIFQTIPTPFVGADFDDSTSTTYSVVPDDYDDILPTAIAIECARVMGKYDIAEEINARFYGRAKGGVGVGRYIEFQMNLADVPAQLARATWTNSNIPNPAMADDPLSGGYFGSLPGYGP